MQQRIKAFFQRPATIAVLALTALYAVSNVVFLLILRKPVGNKLNRIKIKYGV